MADRRSRKVYSQSDKALQEAERIDEANKKAEKVKTKKKVNAKRSASAKKGVAKARKNAATIETRLKGITADQLKGDKRLYYVDSAGNKKYPGKADLAYIRKQPIPKGKTPVKPVAPKQVEMDFRTPAGNKKGLNVPKSRKLNSLKSARDEAATKAAQVKKPAPKKPMTTGTIKDSAGKTRTVKQSTMNLRKTADIPIKEQAAKAKSDVKGAVKAAKRDIGTKVREVPGKVVEATKKRATDTIDKATSRVTREISGEAGASRKAARITKKAAAKAANAEAQPILDAFKTKYKTDPGAVKRLGVGGKVKYTKPGVYLKDGKTLKTFTYEISEKQYKNALKALESKAGRAAARKGTAGRAVKATGRGLQKTGEGLVKGTKAVGRNVVVKPVKAIAGKAKTAHAAAKTARAAKAAAELERLAPYKYKMIGKSKMLQSGSKASLVVALGAMLQNPDPDNPNQTIADRFEKKYGLVGANAMSEMADTMMGMTTGTRQRRAEASAPYAGAEMDVIEGPKQEGLDAYRKELIRQRQAGEIDGPTLKASLNAYVNANSGKAPSTLQNFANEWNPNRGGGALEYLQGDATQRFMQAKSPAESAIVGLQALARTFFTASQTGLNMITNQIASGVGGNGFGINDSRQLMHSRGGGVYIPEPGLGGMTRAEPDYTAEQAVDWLDEDMLDDVSQKVESGERMDPFRGTPEVRKNLAEEGIYVADEANPAAVERRRQQEQAEAGGGGLGGGGGQGAGQGGGQQYGSAAEAYKSARDDAEETMLNDFDRLFYRTQHNTRDTQKRQRWNQINEFLNSIGKQSAQSWHGLASQGLRNEGEAMKAAREAEILKFRSSGGQRNPLMEGLLKEMGIAQKNYDTAVNAQDSKEIDKWKTRIAELQKQVDKNRTASGGGSDLVTVTTKNGKTFTIPKSEYRQRLANGEELQEINQGL